MSRELKTKGIVLRNYRIGDFHKGVVLLTENYGIINAIAHGGYKGKSHLGSKTDQFNSLLLNIYHNPVKDSYKITDAQCLFYFEGIKSNLKKIYVASFFSELTLKTFAAGGEHFQVRLLLQDALEGLDGIEAGKIDLVTIQYLFRFLSLSGFSLQIDSCSGCGKAIPEKGPLYLSLRENSFFCAVCSNRTDFPLSPGSKSYLRYTRNLSLIEAVKIGFDAAGQKQLKGLLLRLVEGIVETKLISLDSGGDYL